MGGGHVPQRRCLGCGYRTDKHALARFVVVAADAGGRLIRDDRSRHPGRGLYVCRSGACFDRAVERRAFAMAARSGHPVAIDPAERTAVEA
jgi:hypothetical protein